MTAAESQAGTFTYAQARAAGYSRGQIADRVAAKAWRRVQPRTFRVCGAPRNWQGRVHEAIGDNKELVASYRTSAAGHGLERVAAYELIEVTRPGLGKPRREGGVLVHRSRALLDVDVTTIDGLRFTTGERTLIDLAAVLANVELLAAIDDAIGRRIADRTLLHQRGIALTPGRRGVKTLVRATGPGAEAEFRSWLERQAAQVFATGSLPPPRFNHELKIGRGRTAFADAWWPPDLVVELNGLRFHDLTALRGRDSHRNNDLTIDGYRVLVFTYVDIATRPSYVVATIRRALAAAA